MANLRLEADKAVLRAEEAENKNKILEQSLLEKDHEILSLTHKLDLATQQLEKAEADLDKYKKASLEGEQSKTTSEGLSRKVQLLEEELDAAEKNVKETVEKCAILPLLILIMLIITRFWYRLRQVDVKAEHFERQLQRAEQEREAWEKKYEVCCLLPSESRFIILIKCHPFNANPPGIGSQISQIAEGVGRFGGGHAGSVILSHKYLSPFMIMSLNV